MDSGARAVSTGRDKLLRVGPLGTKTEDPDFAELLETVAPCVKPGGQLVYAVCSPEPEEGQEVAEGFSARTPFYRLERLWNSVPPHANEDAFFGASWTNGGPEESD